jgi:signal transduction histidine kinase
MFADTLIRPERPAAATRAVGALSIIAHDLKGPLANLALLVSAIGMENAKARPDRRTALAQRAERLIDRLDQMLSGLIERERAFGDPLALVAGERELGALLGVVAACNEASAERRYVRLETRIAGSLPIRGDGELIMQAIDNLLSNAIRHTPPGGRVTCTAGVEADGFVSVRIRDSGKGMDDDALARAFRPFARLGTAGGAAGKGHGLGLWIVRLIAENHGGRVTAARNPSGHGMTFTLTLPARAG